MRPNLMSKAIEEAGLQPLADACGVTYQAVRKWEKNGLPRTEWTGETNHAEAIEIATNGKVKKSALLQRRSA